MMGQRRGLAATRVVNQQDYISRLDQRRDAEARVNVIHKYQGDNNRWAANQASDARVEVQRRQNRRKQQQEELATLEGYETQQQEKAQRAMLREQDDQMAAALYDMKSQKLAEETNSRRICEESEELKELKEKLRAAKISKVRATQMEERALLDRQSLTQDRALDHMMEDDRQNALMREHDEAQRKFFLNLQSRGVLLNQINERQDKKREAYEGFMAEKALVDDIVAGIEKDDREKLIARKQYQKDLQETIRVYLEDRAEWRAAERRRTEEELAKIRQFNVMAAKRHEEAQKKEAQKKDAQIEVLARISREMEQKQREEDEMQELLNELYQEEAEQKALTRLKNEADMREKRKNEMFTANERQKQLKNERAEQLRAEEAKFRENMMVKFAEDKRLEQMNEARKRRETANYKAEVERLVEERRAMYQAAVDAEDAEARRAGDQEKYRLSVVERERQRLLREHAEDLKDFLPKGVLQSSNDYEVIYGQKPRRDLNGEAVSFIMERNKRSTINLGGVRKNRPNTQTQTSDWWGDGSVASTSRPPSSGRRR